MDACWEYGYGSLYKIDFFLEYADNLHQQALHTLQAVLMSIEATTSLRVPLLWVPYGTYIHASVDIFHCSHLII